MIQLEWLLRMIKMKHKLLLTLFILIVLLISGCTTYNSDLICEEYCGGEMIKEHSGLSYYVECTAPNGWNLSGYKEGYFEVKCMVLE